MRAKHDELKCLELSNTDDLRMYKRRPHTNLLDTVYNRINDNSNKRPIQGVLATTGTKFAWNTSRYIKWKVFF